MEHILINYQNKVKSKDLYQLYTAWAEETKVPIVAKNNKFGSAIKRLFDSELKQHHVDGKPVYFYENVQYISANTREDFCERVTLPPHASMVIENELLILYFATTIFFDSDLLEYKVIYSTADQSFTISLRGHEVDNAKFGLSYYADFDQMFIDGLCTFLRTLVMCKGRDIEIPEDRASKVPHQHTLGILGSDGQEDNVVNRSFSRNCSVVMPFLREHDNFTCAKCNHDLNRLVKELDEVPSEADENGSGLGNDSISTDPLSSSREKSMEVDGDNNEEKVLFSFLQFYANCTYHVLVII